MLFGSHTINIDRLWITALLLAILIPIVVGLVHTNRIRISNLATFVLGVGFGISAVCLLESEIQKVWIFTKTGQGSLSYDSWDIPILLCICSGLVTWAITRKEFDESKESKQPNAERDDSQCRQ